MARHDVIDEELIRFAAGELGGPETEAVRRALASSPERAACADALRGVFEAMAAPPFERPSRAAVRLVVDKFADRGATLREWLERVERFAVQLVYDSGARPALAGFRGGDTPRQLSFESERGDVDLQVSPRVAPSDPLEPGSWNVRGQVTTPEGADAPVHVVLFDKGSDHVTEGDVDEHGRFVIAGRQGGHSLLVELDDGVSAIQIEDLVLG